VEVVVEADLLMLHRHEYLQRIFERHKRFMRFGLLCNKGINVLAEHFNVAFSPVFVNRYCLAIDGELILSAGLCYRA